MGETIHFSRANDSSFGGRSGDAHAQDGRAEPMLLDLPLFSDRWSRQGGMTVENTKRLHSLKRGMSFRRIPSLRAFRFTKEALRKG